MLAVIGTMGILGCAIAATIIGVLGTVIGAGITTGMTIYSSQQAEEAAEDMKNMQADELAKQKNQALADKRIQEKLVDRNLIEAKGQMGSAIAYQKLIADRTRRKAAKESAEAKGLDGSSFNKATYSTGTPASSA